MTCGIYLIKNKNTGQQYIGQSKNIEERFRQHKRGDGCKKQRIDRAILKYGYNNFTYSIICKLEYDDDLLNVMEEYYIWKYNTYEDKNHYNLTPGGDFCPMKVPEIAKKQSNSSKAENFLKNI